MKDRSHGRRVSSTVRRTASGASAPRHHRFGTDAFFSNDNNVKIILTGAPLLFVSFFIPYISLYRAGRTRGPCTRFKSLLRVLMVSRSSCTREDLQRLNPTRERRALLDRKNSVFRFLRLLGRTSNPPRHLPVKFGDYPLVII